MTVRVSKNDFYEKVYYKLYEALGEYYKMEIAKLIGRLETVEYWNEEVRGLLDEFSDIIERPTKANFKRLKVIDAVLDELQQVDISRRRWAIRKLRGRSIGMWCQRPSYQSSPNLTGYHKNFLLGFGA